MSVQYQKELFNNGKVRLYMNFSNIKDDVADENITLHFYAIDSNSVPIFTETLKIKEIRELYNHLAAISVISNGKSKSSKIIETTDEINFILNQLKENDLKTVLKFLEKIESEEKVRGLLESLSDLEIENLHGAFHYKLISREIENLENLIELDMNNEMTNEIKKFEELNKYTARQPEKIFQNWIEANLWIFGVDYIKKHDSRKISLFSEGDILMESVDGYLDLIELKRPRHTLLKFDKSHKCNFPHPDLSQVIGQSLFYLQKLGEYKLNLENEYKIKVIMPRVKIIVGRNNKLDESQKDCLRMLNTNLNSVQIITYDDLISYGKLLMKNYSNKKIDSD